MVSKLRIIWKQTVTWEDEDDDEQASPLERRPRLSRAELERRQREQALATSKSSAVPPGWVGEFSTPRAYIRAKRQEKQQEYELQLKRREQVGACNPALLVCMPSDVCRLSMPCCACLMLQPQQLEKPPRHRSVTRFEYSSFNQTSWRVGDRSHFEAQ